MEFAQVGGTQMGLLVLGLILSVVCPVGLAVFWMIRKKEPVKTILLGAATFLVFVLILEKPIQNVLISPAHGLGQAITAKPLLFALIIALFPGVFEETGRFVAFKTLLKDRKNKETGISFGIGHGGFEVLYIIGLSFMSYLSYAAMINAGTFGTVVEQVRALAPDQADQVVALAAELAAFSAGDLAAVVVERFFAVLFHIGASILVFYACRDKEKIWLYPLAILLHTLLDGVAALITVGIISPSVVVTEIILALASTLVFGGAYLLLYRKDTYQPEESSVTAASVTPIPDKEN